MVCHGYRSGDCRNCYDIDVCFGRLRAEIATLHERCEALEANAVADHGLMLLAKKKDAKHTRILDEIREWVEACRDGECWEEDILAIIDEIREKP